MLESNASVHPMAVKKRAKVEKSWQFNDNSKMEDSLRRVFCETVVGKTTVYSTNRSPCVELSKFGMPSPLIVCTNPVRQSRRCQFTSTSNRGVKTHLVASPHFAQAGLYVHQGGSGCARIRGGPNRVVSIQRCRG
jgi:hypothetical protein